MFATPKLLSLALVFLICLTPLAGSAQREVVLGLLVILAGLDAGAAVKTTVVAMEQVATWVAELLSVRVLPFYLALSALAWVGIPPTVKAGGSAKASACQTCASSAAGAMCGAEGRGGCGSSKAGADASACGCSAKAAAGKPAPRPLNNVPLPGVSRVVLPAAAAPKPGSTPPTSTSTTQPVPVTPPQLLPAPKPATITVPSAPAASTATPPEAVKPKG
jgi:hypothetical protein